MKLSHILSAAAALSLSATPAIAAGTPASQLSVANHVRAASPAQHDSKQLFEDNGWIVPVVVAVAIGVGLYLVLDDDDDGADSRG